MADYPTCDYCETASHPAKVVCPGPMTRQGLGDYLCDLAGTPREPVGPPDHGGIVNPDGTITMDPDTERRIRDAARKRSTRHEAKLERVGGIVDDLVTDHAAKMITLTFPGDGAPVPSFDRWQPMYRSWMRSMKRHGLASWGLAVPHTMSKGGRNADIHVLCDFPQGLFDVLTSIGGSGDEGRLHNVRTKKLGASMVSLQEIAETFGFGRRVDIRDTDLGASAYLLGAQWEGHGPWQSGRWT